MDTPAQRIIAKFGSIRALARALGHANPTTVQGWSARGVIPARQVPVVRAAAVQRQIDVRPEDFLLPSVSEAPRT